MRNDVFIKRNWTQHKHFYLAFVLTVRMCSIFSDGSSHWARDIVKSAALTYRQVIQSAGESGRKLIFFLWPDGIEHLYTCVDRSIKRVHCPSWERLINNNYILYRHRLHWLLLFKCLVFQGPLIHWRRNFLSTVARSVVFLVDDRVVKETSEG